MSAVNKLEECFQLLDRSSTFIAKEYNKTYLEALIDTAEQFFQSEEFQRLSLSKENVRRAMQLAILNGMKEEAIPGTGVTPDTVAMLIAYLASRLSTPTAILDPAIGTANLLTCVLNQYDHPRKAYGIEVDATLVRLAYVNTNLQEYPVELYHQDALKPLYIASAELTVCDLPVGIYPNEKVAKNYQLYNQEQPMYTHHLLIEQSLRMTVDGGYLIFLIPNTLFVEPGADRLRQFITEQAYVQAVLQLPNNLFQEGSIFKSIFILQKKGENIKKPNQTLVAQLPSFSSAEAFSKVLDQINEWIASEKREHMV